MNIFAPLLQRLEDWHIQSERPFHLYGVGSNLFPLVYFDLLHEANTFSHQDHIIIFPRPEQAEDFYTQAKETFTHDKVFYFPGLEVNPYRSIYPSERGLYERWRLLHLLHRSSSTEDNPRKIIVTTGEALQMLQPPRAFFQRHSFDIRFDDILAPEELAKKLIDIGYQHSITVEEPGTFSKKGEIFDIFPVSGPPIRLHYFDELIEEIFFIDITTHKTRREAGAITEKISLAPAPGVLSQSEYSTRLRNQIPMPETKYKDRFEARKQLFQYLSDGKMFEGHAAFVPLFFENTATFLDYFDEKKPLLTFVESEECFKSSIELFEELLQSHAEEVEDIYSLNLLPPPDELYLTDLNKTVAETKSLLVDHVQLDVDLSDNVSGKVELKLEPLRVYLSHHVNPALDRYEYIKQVLSYIKKTFAHSGKVIFVTKSESAKKEIEYLLSENEIPSDLKKRMQFLEEKADEGFFYSAGKVLYITEGDLFARKQRKAKRKTQADTDLFAEQLASLKVGDFVIHNDHGVGIYQGLQTMDMGGTTSDYLVIHYTDNDKIYVPVYRMNLIQKHADASAEIKPANLRTNKFQNAKARAKKSAKELAFDLLKLQAERESSEAFAFSPPDHMFREFEMAFPFQETADQHNAIEEVLEKMQRNRPMDFLVCGDVGFGKTEVAMRAGFKAVLDGKQVAILAPTTILVLQHYHSFVRRFKNFPVKIEFLSRFKTTKEANKIKQELEDGAIDIIIGTHRLLSDSVKYKDLGLVVVDEEQRFGVGHKEKLKLLKSSVDFLTLTATPIPRTLQLAFLGLRDLALIKTAPPRRQSIKSYIIKEDRRTIQMAIEKELKRGGQVFIVHNKVHDIELYTAKIRELVPEANIVFAHGQLPEKELEKRMQAFYEGKYQILISTTIIESGIDIPNANTMIIDRADTFGLAQLHQLRGRIGRSERKAYAYFVIPNDRKLSDIAQKRLHALQTYADMGSGFSIASSDLEIRGAGDILGANQSGHIESVGLELYMELLKEAIAEIKGTKQIIRRDIEIATPFASYLPNNYITDSSERLKTYKKLANCDDLEKLAQYEDDLEDIFGHPPKEVQNLVATIRARVHLQGTGLKSLKVAGPTAILQFDKKILDENESLRNKIVETFIQKPKLYQFTPDFKVVYNHKKDFDASNLVLFAADIAQQIVPC